ncbi:MFS transporter [Actinomadura geliboluensis]|uniref:Putative proline/betaine transporter n=1 Tax=Actinomadura geliboluensis TaxID=882440 RepID=A0A5S4GWN0_9ACTN|nr:MFS transporter [Actinomadura geliboluensis]TMR37383.1 MHS family MFS transporter [Actinomadura geliboluensis]
MSNPAPPPPATTPPVPSADPSADGVAPGTRRRVVAASFIGNFIEWFDYAAYGYLAATISTVFFPATDRTTALLATFAVFAISFFVRPLGGFVWGHIGDKMGRRNALSLSIVIMSGATFCIALLPTYQAVGLLAPLLLLVVRVVQGFSASGEYAGASAFLVEYAPRRRRGLYASVVPASTATGLLLGSLLAALLTGVLSTDQMHSWGWRLPFLLAAPMGLIGRYIRLRLEDTPAFLALEEQHDVARTPVKQMLRANRRPLALATGATILNAVAFYILLSYLPTYLSEELHFGAAESFLATTLSLATYIVLIFLTGLASDRFGRKKMLITASVLFIWCTVPAFALLDGAGLLTVIALQVLLGGMLTLNDGTLPSFLAELFPTRVRYSGFAVSFNLANALFGGTAPFVATLLISWTGDKLSPAWYLAGAALVSLCAVTAAKETARKPLRND